MNYEGFVKIHRQLLGWEWYTDVNTKTLFIHCLLKANFKTVRYRKNTVKKGSFITSLESLSKETGLTIRQTRTALEHLISTGEVTSKSSSKNRIITVVNYDKYQDTDKQNDKQTTSRRQTSDKQATNKRQATDNSRRKKEVYVSPTEIHIREEGEETAAPLCAEGAGGKPCKKSAAKEYHFPTVKEVREFALTVPGSTVSLACEFRGVFEESRTRFPEDWMELYRRFVTADNLRQDEFLKAVRSGQFAEKWGSFDDRD